MHQRREALNMFLFRRGRDDLLHIEHMVSVHVCMNGHKLKAIYTIGKNNLENDFEVFFTFLMASVLARLLS